MKLQKLLFSFLLVFCTKNIVSMNIPGAFAVKKACIYPAVCLLYHDAFKSELERVSSKSKALIEGINIEKIIEPKLIEEIWSAKTYRREVAETILRTAYEAQDSRDRIHPEFCEVIKEKAQNQSFFRNGSKVIKSDEYRRTVENIKNPTIHAVIMGKNPTTSDIDMLKKFL